MQWEGKGRRHRGCVPWSEGGSFPTGPGVAMLGGLGRTWHLSVQVRGAVPFLVAWPGVKPWQDPRQTQVFWSLVARTWASVEAP